VGELTRNRRRPRLSTTIDPDHHDFIETNARRYSRDVSVIVDQLLADGRRYWDLADRQRRETATFRDDHKAILAELALVRRWVALLLAQQNLAATLAHADGPLAAGDAPRTFGEWEGTLKRIAADIEGSA